MLPEYLLPRFRIYGLLALRQTNFLSPDSKTAARLLWSCHFGDRQSRCLQYSVKGIQAIKKYGHTQAQRQANPSILLNGLLASAIAMTQADRGNIQLFEPASGGLKIKVQRGFKQPFLDFFDEVHVGQAACGTALKTAERVVVEDVTNNPIFLGTAALEVMLDAGALAVQSTPLVSPFGHTLGVVSTHYRKPHRPHAGELDILDRLAYQTIKCIGLTLQPGQVFVS